MNESKQVEPKVVRVFVREAVHLGGQVKSSITAADGRLTRTPGGVLVRHREGQTFIPDSNLKCFDIEAQENAPSAASK